MIYTAYKQIRVEWVEFDGHNVWEISHFVGLDKPICRIDNNSISISRNVDTLSLEIGDILVKHSDGRLTVMAKRDFEIEYTVYN